MGADLGPLPAVAGAVSYLQTPGNENDAIVLVGDEPVLTEHLAQISAASTLPISIAHADETVGMGMNATEALRKKNSSIAVAMRMQKEGLVSAVVSAGHTGAVMATAVLTLGRIPGVSRPAIAATFPNTHDSGTLVIDVGANVDVKPENLLQFAMMGASYSEDILKVRSPKVGLLSIGEERSKGNELVLAGYDLLKSGPFNFIGNVEGRDVLEGKCDVVVCDGFIGNVILKFAESVKVLLETKIRRQISSNLFSKTGAILMGPFLRRMRRSLDYAEYGGAPLLGINGNCVIGHGKSSEKAIRNAIRGAAEMISTNVTGHIQKRIEKSSAKAVEQ